MIALTSSIQLFSNGKQMKKTVPTSVYVTVTNKNAIVKSRPCHKELVKAELNRYESSEHRLDSNKINIFTFFSCLALLFIIVMIILCM